VLQERTYSRLGSVTQRTGDFRLICTSSVSLEDRVKAGDFRSDLYYRINVNLLRVRPCANGGGHRLVALLFLDQFNSKFGKAAGPFAPEALAALEAAPWPGNVRELQHVIERAVVVNVRGRLSSPTSDWAPMTAPGAIIYPRRRHPLRKPGSGSSGLISSISCIRRRGNVSEARGNRIFRDRRCIAI